MDGIRIDGRLLDLSCQGAGIALEPGLRIPPLLRKRARVTARSRQGISGFSGRVRWQSEQGGGVRLGIIFDDADSGPAKR